MTRVSKKEKTDINMSTPLNLDNFILSDDSCFGKEWSPSDSECIKCADMVVCGCIYSQLVLPKKQEKVKKYTKKNYLDEVNFDRVNKDNLYNSIVIGKTTVMEIANYVKYYSKCEDLESIKEWIRLFKEERKLSFNSGIIYNA